MFEKRLVFCHPGRNLIRRGIVSAYLRLARQDKGVGTTQIEIKMQAHLWAVLNLPAPIAIFLPCTVDEKGRLSLIPEKRDRERVWRPGRINGDKPEKHFLAQAAKCL